MPNPLFSNATSPNGATSPNNPLNDSNKRYSRGYNRFNLSRVFFNTERYADINVIDVVEGVEKDVLPFGNKHEIRSYTLSSPIMFDIYKKKTYFMVDNQAILPINWQKVYKQPNKGDDVTDDVNCVSYSLFTSVKYFLNWIKENEIPVNATTYNYLWRVVFLLESIFSDGSLLSSMNCHLSSVIRAKQDDNSYISFDEWLEELYQTYTPESGRYFLYRLPSISSGWFTNTSVENASISGYVYRDTRSSLDLMRTDSSFELYFNPENTNYAEFFEHLVNSLKQLTFNHELIGSENDYFNLSRLIAYQLVCTQFYTNDSVDNIYNAELFMQNARDHALLSLPNNGLYNWPQFTYNGTRVDYDVFSGRVIDDILARFFEAPIASGIYSVYENPYHYLHMIFFFRKSLRYGDYFVGAKTLPFAPGDVTADVVNNGVSALDMTRKILMQRFLNSVNRARNTWKDYLKDVTDGIAPPNPLEPRFLASSTSKVGGFEVENTAEAQFTNENITTILKSGNSNYVYEVEVGEPCIIIGVSTYEVPRVYSKTVERFFKHRDRFDMFNKFMQNIGDQEIMLGERNAFYSWLRPFGYTPRHMEYKQRYNIASGGFIRNLPGFAFISDNSQSQNDDELFVSDDNKITPFFIRNKNSEFDRFYKSLTGLSLSYYFHFICKYDCICDARRQMEFNPTIL